MSNNPSKPNKSVAARLTDTLASVKFAVTVVVLIAAACVAGTILPQGTDVVAFLRKNPAASGGMELFGTLGLTHVFYSWWFVGLLCTLSASVFVCSARRFATVRRTSGYACGRALGSMLTHISILLILAGGVVRGVWGEKGYVEFREGDTKAQFVVDGRERPLPFALHLGKFEIETYAAKPMEQHDDSERLLVAWPEKKLKATLPIKLGIEQQCDEFKITILKYVPDFVVDMSTKEVTSRSSEPRNPAILVAVAGPGYSNHRWLFAKFPDSVIHSKDNRANPDSESGLQMVYQNHGAVEPRRSETIPTGPIKSFRSTVQLIEGETVVGERKVEVNSPLKYKGYTFYQSGYNPNDLSYTSLQVVKDPGVPIVYMGFGLMIVGLSIVFYINPWLNERRSSAGVSPVKAAGAKTSNRTGETPALLKGKA